MFAHKAQTLLRHREELGLSDAQVDKIRALETETNKKSIQQTADVKIAALDIQSKLRGDNVDLQEINALIDQKYALKAKEAKLLTAAYVDLKAQLTEEQRVKLKQLKRNKDRSGKKR